MKVYIIANEPFPNGMAATNRIKCYAKGISANGLICNVILNRRTEKKTVNRGNNAASGIIDGYYYQYIGKNNIRNSSLLLRIFNDHMDICRLFIFVLRKISKKDIVLYYSNDILIIKLLLYLSKIKRFKLIKELCEYPNAAKIMRGKLSPNNNSLLNKAFPKVDGFIAISHPLYDLAYSLKKDSSKVLLVPILIDPNICYSCNSSISTPLTPYIFYAGTLSEFKDGFESILQAYSIAIKSIPFPVKFIYASSSKPTKEIINIIKENNIENKVEYLGMLNQKQVMKYYQGASLSIINKNDNLQNKHGFSTKIGEILLSETPLIITKMGEPLFYLKDRESAYFVDNIDPKQIAKAIVRAFSNTLEREKIALNGKKIAQKEFDCFLNGKKIAAFFRQL